MADRGHLTEAHQVLTACTGRRTGLPAPGPLPPARIQFHVTPAAPGPLEQGAALLAQTGPTGGSGTGDDLGHPSLPVSRTITP